MILDARDPAVAAALETSIVIVGAGAAGLTLALTLAEKAVRCVVLEAGGEGVDAAAQDLYRAASITPDDHGPVHLYRRRALGGTTAIWGGRCIPFDPIDFADRPWIAHARWPITYDEVASYYPRALEICRAGPALFDAASALPGSGAPLIDGVTAADIVLDRIERFSEPTHFGRHYRDRLAASPHVRLIINANAVEITVDAAGQHVTGVEAATNTGRRLTVRAPRVVVAGGALETARLLLASRSVRPNGLGNDGDLVGRFYQSHLEGEVGEIHFKASPAQVRLDYERSPEGVYCRRYIWLSPDAQRREHLAGLVLRPHHRKIADPAHGNPVLSAMYLVKDMIVPEYGRGMNSVEQGAAMGARRASVYARHLANIVRGSPRLAAFAVDWVRRRNLATRKLPSVVLRDRANRYVLDVNAEQAPNPDSRVTLGSECDVLGMPRLRIDWRTTAQDRDMILRGLRILQSGFVGSAATIDLKQAEQQVAALTRVGGHHIGTARMGRNAREGVVDGHGHAYDTGGLFVAGAAAFPVSGFANPTLVIVALALRLADHLAATRP